MTRDEGGGRSAMLAAAAVTGVLVLVLVWLVAVALAPALLDVAPPALAWLGTPGSVGAMTVVLLLSAAAFTTLVVTRWRASLRLPFLLSAWCAGTALPLAMAAYLPCTGDSPVFWEALSNTFALFLGSVERPFGPGEACTYPVPLALQVARLLAIVATLTGAMSVVFSLYRSQLDRVAMLRARSLVAVIGVDESSWPVLQRLARGGDRALRTVVLTADTGAIAERARALGVLVLRTGTDDPLGLREGYRWHRTVRCYLLSADAAANRSRAMLLRRALPGLRRPPQGRLGVIARIDDPWHADDFRKRSIGDPGFLFDAVGTYEATAEALVARVRALPGTTHVLVAGGGPLALALLAEFSQRGRELQFLDEETELPRVWLLGRDAEELAADHGVRQQRFASDPVVVSTRPGAGTLEDVLGALADVTAAGGSAVVVVTRAGSRLGTRLAVRRPDLPILELSADARVHVGDEPVVGGLTWFSLTLAQPSGRAADAWERAARALHERYRRRFPGTPLAVPWDELPREFYRESNRRALAALLDGMVALGRSWAPTRPDTTPAGETGLTEEELDRLAEAEHESWREHHLADGWRHADVRDEAARRHPDLLPWAELGAQARAKTRAGVVDTLFQLRALGYRAVPADEGRDDDWATYRRVGRVTARRLTAPLAWRTGEGGVLPGEAGDWRVEDDSGGVRTVADASFRATHRHLDGDVWERTGEVRARPVVPGESIHTQEGPVTAGATGWVVRDADGNAWIVGVDHFGATYRRA